MLSPAPADGEPVGHTVVKGEYLFKILRRYGFSEAEAQAAMAFMGKSPRQFGITSGSVHILYPGDTICLPRREDVLEEIPAEPPAPEPVVVPVPVPPTPPRDGLGRLAELVEQFKDVPTTPADPPPPPSPAVPAQPPRPEPLRARSGTRVTVGDLVGRPAEERPEPRELSPLLETLPRWGDPFVPLYDGAVYNVHRPYNYESPETWMRANRCGSCRHRTCKLCVLLKYLTCCDLWESIAIPGPGE
ncbi:MAG: hypothetical protein ACYCW6_08420 [Candidatus Xenobia bacterium]